LGRGGAQGAPAKVLAETALSQVGGKRFGLLRRRTKTTMSFVVGAKEKKGKGGGECGSSRWGKRDKSLTGGHKEKSRMVRSWGGKEKSDQPEGIPRRKKRGKIPPLRKKTRGPRREREAVRGPS